MNAAKATTRRNAAVGIATTAGAIVALMAIAATVATGPSARPAMVESRTSLAESSPVRAVAAAMAAMARELAGGERVDAAMPATLVLAPLAEPAVSFVIIRRDRAIPIPATLDERLLDLPPPGC